MSKPRHQLQQWEDLNEDKTMAGLIFMAASEGLTRASIRKKLKISVPTWQRMIQQKDEYPIYMNALLKGEILGSEKMVEALKNRAVGYEYEETHNDEMRGIKVITKHVPADVNAIKYYLNNIDPNNWKDKRIVEQTVVTKTEEIDYEKMSPQALRELLLASGRVGALPAQVTEVKSNE